MPTIAPVLIGLLSERENLVIGCRGNFTRKSHQNQKTYQRERCTDNPPMTLVFLITTHCQLHHFSFLLHPLPSPLTHASGGRSQPEERQPQCRKALALMDRIWYRAEKGFADSHPQFSIPLFSLWLKHFSYHLLHSGKKKTSGGTFTTTSHHSHPCKLSAL